MDTDQNLLFGVLALQVDLIDPGQFAEACTNWSAKKSVPLADILVELNWISPMDKDDVERLMARRLRKHNEDMKASLAASVDAAVQQTLAGINDPDIDLSLVELRDATPASVATTIFHVPEPKERYGLTNLHAKGGIGQVWLARDHQLGRDVALKDIRPDMRADPTIVNRFLNEAQITGQLEHPGIVPVYELARRPDDQQPYYTMRFVKGKTLSEATRDLHRQRDEGKEEPLDFVTLLRAFTTVCNTVAYAHSRGVIHRDLKGQNVILGDFGEVIVLDWGLAKLVDQTDEHVESRPVMSQTDAQLTMQGDTLGTPAYMAPEQAAGRLDQIDKRTDVYSLGAVFYEILTGQPPFTGSNAHEVLRKVLQQEPNPPSQIWPEVPPALEVACLRALAKDPDDRYQTGSELAQDVQKWQETERRRGEQALAFERDLFHALMDTVPDLIYFKDVSSRFIRMNRTAAHHLGISSPEEAVGKTDADFFTEALAQTFRADELEVMRTNWPMVAKEERVFWPDGGVTWLSTLKVPFRNKDGEIVGTLGIARDIKPPELEGQQS